MLYEFPNYPIEPENLYKKDEEKEIDDLRKMKKEEWRRKEEDVKSKIKIDKEIKEKEIEVTRKQKEFERKNVTTDVNGNIIFIKALGIDKLNNDFLNAKFDVKNKGEVSNVLSLNRDKIDNKDFNKNEKSTLMDRFNQSKNNKTIKERGLNAPKENPGNRSGIGKVELINSSMQGGSNANTAANVNPGPITLQALTVDRMERMAVTPAGSSFGLIMPEIGVTVIEGGQSKFGGGGREYYKAFQKYSKYDYLTMLKDSSTNFGSTMKDFNIDSLNVQFDIGEKKDILPNIGYRTRNESFVQSTGGTKNSGSGNLKFNPKLIGSLRSALENLEEGAEDNIVPDEPQNNSNIFKKTKKDDLENDGKSLEEINKFTYSIVHNQQWGSNATKGHYEKYENRAPYKPELKDIEKEIGKNILKTKMPRARAYTYVKNPLEMSNTSTGFNAGGKASKSKKDRDTFNQGKPDNFTQTQFSDKYSNFNHTAYTGMGSYRK